MRYQIFLSYNSVNSESVFTRIYSTNMVTIMANAKHRNSHKNIRINQDFTYAIWRVWVALYSAQVWIWVSLGLIRQWLLGTPLSWGQETAALRWRVTPTRAKAKTVPPFPDTPSWHTEGNLNLSLPYVYFYLHMNMYFITTFKLNNPKHFLTCVDTRNRDRLCRPNANLSFREFCLLRWH